MIESNNAIKIGVNLVRVLTMLPNWSKLGKSVVDFYLPDLKTQNL